MSVLTGVVGLRRGMSIFSRRIWKDPPKKVIVLSAKKIDNLAVS